MLLLDGMVAKKTEPFDVSLSITLFPSIYWIYLEILLQHCTISIVYFN